MPALIFRRRGVKECKHFPTAKIQKFQYANKNVKKYLKYFVYLQRLFNDRTKTNEKL